MEEGKKIVYMYIINKISSKSTILLFRSIYPIHQKLNAMLVIKPITSVICILIFLSSPSSTSNRNDTVINAHNVNITCSLNGNVTDSCEQQKSHGLNDRKTLSFYYITIVLTIIAYALVLPSAYRKKQPSSVFIFSLAIADAFIALVIVPIKISEVYGSTWQKNIVFCRLVNSITLFGIGLASTNIVVVSIDRALYFAFPLKYRDIVTNKRAVFASFVAFLSSVPALLPSVGIGGLHSENELEFCAFKFSLRRWYMWFIGIGYFCIPSVLIIVLQVDIIRRTRSYYKQHREFIKMNPNDKKREEQMQLSMKREMRIQRMFLAIIVMFFVCWGPFVVGIICNLVATHLITPFFIQLMRIMLFINSFMNPTIIFLSTCDIKKYFARCWFQRKGVDINFQSTSAQTNVTNVAFEADSF